MKQIHRVGNLPTILKTFLTNTPFGETETPEVFEATYDEIIKKANEEKYEVQVIIDKQLTGNAYLCACGASVRTLLLYGVSPLKPVFYFAKLDEPKKRQFQKELREARAKVASDHKKKLKQDKILKEAARNEAKKLLD